MTSLGLVKTVAQGAFGRARQRPTPVLGTPITHRFTVLTKLNEGGMGSVHLVEDRESGLPLALKMPHDPTGNVHVQSEIDTLISLSEHPNLAGLHTHGFDPEKHLVYYTMPYITGESLDEVLQKGPLPLAETLRVVKAIASGLSSAAAHGVTHKDLKPANIMFCLGGEIKVIDFGISHVVPKPGDAVGTPGHMSPEQIKGSEIDLRSDIFALGLIVQEMIDGHSPLGKDISHMPPIKLMMDTLDSAEKGLPRLRYFSIDDEVRSLTQAFVDRMTAFRREDRFQTYEELIAAAERIEARLAAFNAETARELAALNPGPLA